MSHKFSVVPGELISRARFTHGSYTDHRSLSLPTTDHIFFSGQCVNSWYSLFARTTWLLTSLVIKSDQGQNKSGYTFCKWGYINCHFTLALTVFCGQTALLYKVQIHMLSLVMYSSTRVTCRCSNNPSQEAAGEIKSVHSRGRWQLLLSYTWRVNTQWI